MSRLLASGGQSIGVAASASVLPMNIQDLFPLGWTGWISLQSKRLSRVFSSTTVWKLLQHSAFFTVQLSHPCMTTGRTIALTTQIFVSNVISLLFDMLYRFDIAFLPSSKCLNFMAPVYGNFGAWENKVCRCFHCFPICLPWSDGTRCHDLCFLNAEF